MPQITTNVPCSWTKCPLVVFGPWFQVVDLPSALHTTPKSDPGWKIFQNCPVLMIIHKLCWCCSRWPDLSALMVGKLFHSCEIFSSYYELISYNYEIQNSQKILFFFCEWHASLYHKQSTPKKLCDNWTFYSKFLWIHLSWSLRTLIIQQTLNRTNRLWHLWTFHLYIVLHIVLYTAQKN